MKKENKLANSVPKKTSNHPWRKMNNCLQDYSQKNLTKNKRNGSIVQRDTKDGL